MASSALFQATKVGSIPVANRVFMAPLTRCRATEFTHIPTDMMVEYYASRAAAGLIIAEATMVQENHSSFYREPGIYSDEQVAGWSKITKAVHDKGGKIVLQLHHGGRTVVPANSETAIEVVAPSAIPVEGHQIAEGFNPKGVKMDYAVPRALEDSELPTIKGYYVKAAKNAIAAGFDGVEIHGANGYLLDEFLRSGTNKREAPYGGNLENRARFPLEVADAVIAAVGADRVGYRISPVNAYTNMHDEDPVAMTAYISKQLSDRKIAYLHVMRRCFFTKGTPEVLSVARKNFEGFLVANMGYTKDEADKEISEGGADAIAFGAPFIANPDLVERFQTGHTQLNEVNWAGAYSHGPEGYIDYPTMATN